GASRPCARPRTSCDPLLDGPGLVTVLVDGEAHGEAQSLAAGAGREHAFAAEEPRALADVLEPAPVAGGARKAGAVVFHVEHRARRPRAFHAQPHRRRLRARVARHVGERLLHDAVAGQLHLAAEAAAHLVGDVARDLEAGRVAERLAVAG